MRSIFELTIFGNHWQFVSLVHVLAVWMQQSGPRQAPATQQEAAALQQTGEVAGGEDGDENDEDRVLVRTWGSLTWGVNMGKPPAPPTRLLVRTRILENGPPHPR